MLSVLACTFYAGGIAAQTKATVRFSVTLVDSDLNVKPVPRHVLLLQRGADEPIRVVTGFDGKAEVLLDPGEYAMRSERPVDFQGKSFRWTRAIVVRGIEAITVDMSVDDATSESIEAALPRSADLPALFRDWQSSVVTVWSETGHGSGFLIDGRGLIATNEHVVGVSEYVAVQFSESLKVPAQVVAKSSTKDVAILRVNVKHVAGIRPVKLGYAEDGKAPAAEGQQVFTIGSPLNQRKVMTSGIVSKIEPGAIISDVNINKGNSGGPLFTTGGVVLGITTFGDFTLGGPGISGIVRIDEAKDIIREAESALGGASPSETALPVEPVQAFPVEALKAAVQARPVKVTDYEFGTSDFDVTLITPVLTYGFDYALKQAALRERAKRNKKAAQDATDPFEGYKNWAEYVGEFRPVLTFDARPKLVEGFWSALGRGLSESQGVYAGPANLHFKSDFYKMKLSCGGIEVTPIHPGKVEHQIAVDNGAVRVNDATYEGFYTYAHDAIGPHCGTVSLALFTEKDPEKPDVRILSPKLVQKVWDDFASYRANVGPSTRSQPVRVPSPSSTVTAPTAAPAASAAPPPAPTVATSGPAVEGYSPQQVTDAIGTPRYVLEGRDGVTTWFYEVDGKPLRVFFFENKASLKRQR